MEKWTILSSKVELLNMQNFLKIETIVILLFDRKKFNATSLNEETEHVLHKVQVGTWPMNIY